MTENPYTCRLLIRIDRVIWTLRGVRPFWGKSGHLVRQWPSGSMSELGTHFPGWMFFLAARIQNRWPWTRKVLSL